MPAPTLLELPDSSCIASVIMTLTRVTGVTISPFTLDEQKFKWPAEQWSIDFRLPVIVDRAIAAEWQAFGVLLEGKYNTFLMGAPGARLPRGSALGAPKIDGASQVGNSIITKDWTPNSTGVLLKGDYIQLGTGSSSRLHMVTNDVDSDGAGNATINLMPALRSSPVDSSDIVTSNARGVFRLVDDSFSWSIDPGPVYRMSFQALEVVNA